MRPTLAARWFRWSARDTGCAVKWSGPSESRDEQLPARGVRYGNHTWVRDAAFHRNRKELLDQLGRAPDHLDAKLLDCFGLQHCRAHEHAATFTAESGHQCTVVELTDDPGMDLVAGQPAFELLAN